MKNTRGRIREIAERPRLKAESNKARHQRCVRRNKLEKEGGTRCYNDRHQRCVRRNVVEEEGGSTFNSFTYNLQLPPHTPLIFPTISFTGQTVSGENRLPKTLVMGEN